MDDTGGYLSSKHSAGGRSAGIADDQEFQEAEVWETVMHQNDHHHFEPRRSSNLKMKKSKYATFSSSTGGSQHHHHRHHHGGQPESSDPLPTPAGGFSNAGGGGEDVEGDNEKEMIPPHEWIARRLARSHISSSSVCEGAGRTLKGRDLSRVRNAVLAKTGFLEPQ